MKLKQLNNKQGLSTFTNSFSNLERLEELSMDWSVDTSVQASPNTCFQSQGILMPNPWNINVSMLSGSGSTILNYSNGQLSDSNLWDGACWVLFLFGSKESLSEDVANIVCSLKRIRKHIKHHLVDKAALYREFAMVAKNLWYLISMIYQLKWDLLIYDKEKQLTINKGILRWFVNKSNDDLDKDEISTKPIEKKSQSESTSTPPPKAVFSALTVFVLLPLNKKVETVTKKFFLMSRSHMHRLPKLISCQTLMMFCILKKPSYPCQLMKWERWLRPRIVVRGRRSLESTW